MHALEVLARINEERKPKPPADVRLHVTITQIGDVYEIETSDGSGTWTEKRAVAESPELDFFIETLPPRPSRSVRPFGTIDHEVRDAFVGIIRNTRGAAGEDRTIREWAWTRAFRVAKKWGLL